MLPPTSHTANSVSIFISSVSKRDKGLRKALENALHPCVQQGLITIWYDEKASGGERPDLEIAEHLDAAHIILLLLSIDTLVLHEFHEQMLRAMERYNRGDATVIPILLRPVDWQGSPCGMLKPLPENDVSVIDQRNRDLAFYKIAEHLRSIALRLKNKPQEQPSIYRQLIKQPPLSRFMLKREQVVHEIYGRLTSPEVTALVLTGMGGSGKSMLAAQVYQYAKERQQVDEGPFVDEILWLTIDATVTLVDIVGSLCAALGRSVPYCEGCTADDLSVELFNLFYAADLPRLIVFDQFETCLDPQTRRVRQKYAGLGAWLDMLNSRPCASRVLLTSRFQPYGAHQELDAYVQKFEIKRLSGREGAQLLHMKIPHIKEAEVALAVEHCQGHPQALVLLRDLLCENHSLSVDAVLNEPTYMRQWVSDIAVNMLNHIYAHHLNQVQRELLLAFSIYREAVPLRAAQIVIETRLHTSTNEFAQALRVLLHHSLLQGLGGLRYQLHPVVADFMHALQVDGYEQVDKQARQLMHARAAHYYGELFRRDPLPIWEQQRVSTIHSLVETIWHLCQAGQKQDAYELICQTELFTHFHRQGSNSILLELYTQLIPLDEWQADASLAAHISNEMGEICDALGQKNQALRQYEHALQCFREIGQAEGIVESLNNLGAAYRMLGQHTRAQDCYQEALSISAGSGIVGRGTTLNNLGKVIYEQGRREQKYKRKELTQSCYMQALAYYEQALIHHQEAERLGEEARTLNNMGEVYAALRQHENAYEYYWRALTCFRAYGERRGEGMVLNNLGVFYKDINRKDVAKDYYIQALRIFREVGDHWQQGRAQRNLGRLYLSLKDADIYERCKCCLACFLQVGGTLEEIQNSQYEVIPQSLEYVMREELGPEKFEQLLKEVEANAASIMEQIVGYETS